MRLVVLIEAGKADPLRAQESLDLAFAALALDWEVSVLVSGAGRHWLLPQQQPSDSRLGPGAGAMSSLPDFDVAGWYWVGEALPHSPTGLQHIARDQAQAICDAADQVIRL